MLSRRCCDLVDIFLESGRDRQTEMKMIECFIRSSTHSHGVCRRELKSFDDGTGSFDSVERCSRKEFGLAMKNLLRTAEANGKCKPI